MDLIIANLHKLYEIPIITAPLGSSDHNSVRWLPKSNNCVDNLMISTDKHLVRRYPQSGINALVDGPPHRTGSKTWPLAQQSTSLLLLLPLN